MVHPGAHEAGVGVGGGTDDRFAADVERGVDDETAAGSCLKGLDDGMEVRGGGAVDGLDTRTIVDVRDGRHVGTDLVDPVNDRPTVGCPRLAMLRTQRCG